MAEGGQLPWKTQTIVENGPSADYSKLSEPLIPPKGMIWQKDTTTREWTLVPDTTKEESKQMEADTGVKVTSSPLVLKKDALKGEDFVEHIVQPTDTFQGICLAYKISATKLRQANLFSGTNLKLAPSKLIIPVDKSSIDTYYVRKHQYDSKEGKVHKFLEEFFPSLREKEARFYLDMADYDLDAAIADAREDLQWEKK